MKRALSILILLMTTVSWAKTITCSVPDHSKWGDKFTGDAGIEKDYEAKCDEGLKAQLSGIGVNLQTELASTNGFVIQCPLMENVKGTYYGLHAEIGFILGVEVGTFYSLKGICQIYGGGLNSFGVSLNEIKLKIY